MSLFVCVYARVWVRAFFLQRDASAFKCGVARLAADYGVPVSLGNTIMEIGGHLAASLPECLFLEFSDLRWNELAIQPVQFRDGLAIAPDQPGHGIELDRDKLAFYSAAGA